MYFEKPQVLDGLRFLLSERCEEGKTGDANLNFFVLLTSVILNLPVLRPRCLGYREAGNTEGNRNRIASPSSPVPRVTSRGKIPPLRPGTLGHGEAGRRNESRSADVYNLKSKGASDHHRMLPFSLFQQQKNRPPQQQLHSIYIRQRLLHRLSLAHGAPPKLRLCM